MVKHFFGAVCLPHKAFDHAGEIYMGGFSYSDDDTEESIEIKDDDDDVCLYNSWRKSCSRGRSETVQNLT